MHVISTKRWLKNYWIFLITVSVLIFLVYLSDLNEDVNDGGDIKAIDKVDWLITDLECLRRLKIDRSCHAPIKVAAYKSTHLSSLFKITHYMNFDTTKNYIQLVPVNGEKDERRLLPRNLKVRRNHLLRLTNAEAQSANIPAEPEFFVRQWLNSRLLECKAIKRDLKDMEKEFEEMRRIPLSKVHIFEDVRKELASIEVIPFLMGGSLLGWRRDCSLIWHTSDIDFGVLPEDLSARFLDHIRRTQSMIHVLGDQHHLRDPPETSFRVADVMVDLFTTMPLNETHIYYQVFKFDKPQSFCAILPKITELCASDLHNYLVYVPCNVDKILETEFGEWRREIHTDVYSYLKAKNLIPNSEFTPSQWSQQHEHFYWQAFVYEMSRFLRGL